MATTLDRRYSERGQVVQCSAHPHIDVSLIWTQLLSDMQPVYGSCDVSEDILNRLLSIDVEEYPSV